MRFSTTLQVAVQVFLNTDFFPVACSKQPKSKILSNTEIKTLSVFLRNGHYDSFSFDALVKQIKALIISTLTW